VVCVGNYAARTYKQQSAPKEQAITQKSVSPFWGLMSGVYRVECVWGGPSQALIQA